MLKHHRTIQWTVGGLIIIILKVIISYVYHRNDLRFLKEKYYTRFYDYVRNNPKYSIILSFIYQIYIFTIIFFQPPFNQVTYQLIGDDPAPTFFRLDNNIIRVGNVSDLETETRTEYTVRQSYVYLRYDLNYGLFHILLIFLEISNEIN